MAELAHLIDGNMTEKDSNSRDFVVRPLQSTGLDGAFRVHVPPEALERLNLKVGELCTISTAAGDAFGYGITWRATDKMGNSPKARPAKMTDMLRNAYGIKEGSHVTLEKVNAEVIHAEKVTLMDVTPTEYMDGHGAEVEDDKWWGRCIYALLNCEAFAVGTTFDVSAKRGIRKRFFVEHVESAAARPGVLNLFYTNDKTHIVTTDGNLSGPQPIETETRSMLLTTDYIGGLVSQLQSLNRRINRVLKHVKNSTKYPTVFQPNEPILIHGYEGTGKSLILSCMASAGFRKVIRIDTKTLNAGTAAKNQAAIEAMFNDARASQPSLVLLDDLQRLVPPSDGLCTATISAELEKLGGSRVLVVAACRSTSDINSDLVGPNRLSDVLELPIPDLHARRQILNVLLPKELDPDRRIVEALCLRTHGFTGKDLSRLLKAAGRYATERHEKEQEGWVNVHRNSFNHKGSLEKLLDGQTYSQAAGRVENEQDEVNGHANGDDRSIDLTLEDFEVAFDTVRPTALREIFCETPKIQWSDIGGSQAMKERFDEIIGWPLKYSEMMKLYRMDTTKGVILYGPPGCSKTLTAQAVANTYDLNFIAVKGAELLSMYVGESERAVREIFRKARAASPCIIFFDEIDSIASERESAGTKGLNVLTTLLNEMDGFESLKNVLVLAATNKPEILDPAIMRPGRFDAHIYLGPPDDPARKEIFAISTKDLPIEEDLDFDNLVKRTDGCTGAEIVQICGSAKREAMIRNIAKGGFRVGMADFDKALLRTEQLSVLSSSSAALARALQPPDNTPTGVAAT